MQAVLQKIKKLK